MSVARRGGRRGRRAACSWRRPPSPRPRSSPGSARAGRATTPGRAPPAAAAPPRSSGATSSTAQTSTARSATPTTATRRARRRHAHAAARPGDRHARPVALRRRRAPRRGCSTARCPAWRDFAPGMTDGADVRQLERNLRALGYDPRHASTTTGTGRRPPPSMRFQDDRGLTEDGTLDARRGRVPRGPGARRRGEGRGRRAGRSRRAGSRELSSTARARHGRPRAGRRQALAREGERVTVDAARRQRRPRADHRRRHGRRSTPAQDGATRRSRSRSRCAAAAAAARLDQAPVTSASRVERRKDVLAVPVNALLARAGRRLRRRARPGGAGSSRVEPGLFADDCVEVARRRPRARAEGGGRAMTPSSRSQDVAQGLPRRRRGAARRVARGRARASCSRSSGRPARASRRCCT